MPWLVGSFNQKDKTKPRDIPTALVSVVPQSEAIGNQPDVAGNDSSARKECRDSMDALLVEATTFGGDYSHSFSKVTQEMRKKILAPISSFLAACANEDTANASIDPWDCTIGSVPYVVIGTCPMLETVHIYSRALVKEK